MDMYDLLFSQSCALNEEVAQQISEIAPERGPVIVLIDKEGTCRPSNFEEFSKLNISESLLRELCGKIDDGAEPVVTQVHDFSIIATQLATERTNCGYVIIVLPQYSPEATLINIDLIEMLLNQISLIAELVEKNNFLYGLQMKRPSVYSQSETASN